MGLTVVSRPDDQSSAYLPEQYVITSDRSPNSRTDEFNLACNISQPTSTLITLFPQLTGTETLLNITGVSVGQVPLSTGQYVKITNTTGGLYEGVFQVSDTLYNGVLHVLDTPFLGTETGTCEIFYKDFSVVADLFIDGSFAVRLRTQHDVNDQFVFDVSRHVQTFVGSDVESTATITRQSADDTSVIFHLEISEEYRDINNDNQITKQTQTTPEVQFIDDVGNSKRGFNTVIQYMDYRDEQFLSSDYDMSDFVSPYGDTTRFLTNANRFNIPIGSDDHYFLTFYDAISAEHYLMVDTFDSSGTLIASNQFETYAAFGVADSYNFPAGTANVASVITAATEEYDVYLENNLGQQQSEKIRFKIDRNCYGTEQRFEWLNEKGGLDLYTFKGRKDRKVEMERKTFKRLLDFPRVIPERTLTTSQDTAVDIYTANSGMVSKSIAEWLEELLISPEVYIHIGKDRFPVHILTNSADINNSFDNLFNISFEYRFAFEKVIQRN